MYDPTAGERLRAARKNRGWSQATLAAAMQPHTSQDMISDIEQGKKDARIDWLTRAAKALGVRTRKLVPRED